jgi:ribosomal protein S18 acetylase RimI-like enzyme
MIRHIEELSLNALPALHTLCFDGWILRLSGGKVRRVNSVHALYEGVLPLEEKIAHCEEIYRLRGQKTVFKLTPEIQPPHLEAVLDSLGYVWQSGTSVQTLALEEFTPPSADSALIMTPQITDKWIKAVGNLNKLEETSAVILQRMLSNITPRACFAALQLDGEIVSTGLAVLEHSFVGIYDIATDERVRNQGLATRIVSQLLGWAKTNGAQYAYLQVVEDNAPAIHLYNKLGFREAYRYWYRSKEH